MLTLPININDLLTGRTVEWERLEFKAGWNPETVLHTMCAFANDFHNLGGGYILIGVEDENGKPIIPPTGISIEQIDVIQKEIVELGYKIIPYYHPVIGPYEIKGKHIIILWVSGGQTRPYKAPVSLSKKEKQYAYYIRKGSVTVRAQHQDEIELVNLSAKIPFDDRIHHTATINDLDLGLIRSYLKQVKSDLFKDSTKMNFLELCRRMNIVDGPDKAVRPKNVGLMFFNEAPNDFFPYTQIEIVNFPDGPGSDFFTEIIFQGPLNRIIQESLSHIKSNIIKEKIIKYPDKPEADRFYNYPLAAVEEIICNALYHRSYEIREPVEISIYPDKIRISSFPGPDRSISEKEMKEYRFLSRRYRNRRIGEFLKELGMTEGRGTGIPKILRELKKNESPLPIFNTDIERSFLVVELPIHTSFKQEILQETLQETLQEISDISGKISKLIKICNDNMTRKELMSALKLSDRVNFVNKYLNPAIEQGFIEMTIPDNPKNRNQRYKLTQKGKGLKEKG